MRPVPARRFVTWAFVLAASAGCNTDTLRGDNHAPEDIRALRDATARLRATLGRVADLLGTPASATDGRHSLPLAAAVGELELGRAMYQLAGLPAELQRDQVEFYAGVLELRSRLDAHVRADKADQPVVKAAMAARAAATVDEKTNRYLAGQVRYAILFASDRDGFGAKLVELGPPMCGNKIAPSGACPEGETTAFTYRASASGVLARADLVTSGDSVPAKALVPLLPTQMLDTLLAGVDGTVAGTLHGQRIQQMRPLADKLVKLAERLDQQLSALAARQ